MRRSASGMGALEDSTPPSMGSMRNSLTPSTRPSLNPRLQQDGSNCLTDLFFNADLLNDELHRKMHTIAVACAAKLLFCEVNKEARALEKMHRSYGGNWRRLTDLVRTSLIFRSIGDMRKCLLMMAEDPEVALIPSGKSKMRFRHASYRLTESAQYLFPEELRQKVPSLRAGAELRGVPTGATFTLLAFRNPGKDEWDGTPAARSISLARKLVQLTDSSSAMFGGYRDVQVLVQIKTPESIRLHTEYHLAEVQLHLEQFHDLKTAEGHRAYVMSRNLRGK